MGVIARQAAQSYTRIGLETQVLSASPQQIITLLFDGALTAMLQARLHLQQGNISDRGQAISRAIDIVESGLKAGVNDKADGTLASNLITTYDLVVQNLMLANLRADIQKLDLAVQLLTNISEAWKTATGVSVPSGPPSTT